MSKPPTHSAGEPTQEWGRGAHGPRAGAGKRLRGGAWRQVRSGQGEEGSGSQNERKHRSGRHRGRHVAHGTVALCAHTRANAQEPAGGGWVSDESLQGTLCDQCHGDSALTGGSRVAPSSCHRCLSFLDVKCTSSFPWKAQAPWSQPVSRSPWALCPEGPQSRLWR